MKLYYVWTRDRDERATCWIRGTRAECRRFILGRWGHWPPFAVVSQINNERKFLRRYGP